MKKIIYTTEIITESGLVEPMGATSISFEVIGTAEAEILDIPLTTAKIREFSNESGIIQTSFNLKFATTGTQKILVVRTFIIE